MTKIKLGELRRSQAVHTFGIGCTVDLPRISAMVMGTQFWSVYGWDPLANINSIREPRLLQLLRDIDGFPLLEQLTELPATPVELEDNSAGVPLTIFPCWLRCPKCEIAAHIRTGVFAKRTDLYRPEEFHYEHIGCTKKPRGMPSNKGPTVHPVRFVYACRNGHIHDFPWKRYLTQHHNCGPNCCKTIKLQEQGVAGEVSKLWVRCAATENCDASMSMMQAFMSDAERYLGPCKGHHPHLGEGHMETCVAGEPRAMLLGASNQWFGITVSALSLPEDIDPLINAIVFHWDLLAPSVSIEDIQSMSRLGLLPVELRDFEIDAIWNAIEQYREGQQSGEALGSYDDLKIKEWELFANPSASPSHKDFKIQSATVHANFKSKIEDVVAVERLRLVQALTGFTRIDSPGDFADPTDIPESQRVSLAAETPRWLPSYEVRGEGVFIRLSEEAIADWRSQPLVKAREDELKQAHIAFRTSKGLPNPDDGMDVLRFTLLHTLSHLLIREFAIECGYHAASIQERIYSKGVDAEDGPMAGFLLMTASPDSEGTLGGLVELSKPELLGRHLSRALERAELCASDPLCSEHAPAIEPNIKLHGACCHACGFVSETSCERGNKYLDRSLLVPVMGCDTSPFFDGSES